MSHDISILRLQDAWRECQRHVHHLRHALNALQSTRPLTGQKLASLDDESVQDLDQFVLRFGKLQDAIGARLLPSVLLYLQEPYESRPMLDKLHRLEKLGYLERASDWQQLRAIRNQFAHDYPDDPEKNAALLNLAIESVDSLEGILARVGYKLDAIVKTAQATSVQRIEKLGCAYSKVLDIRQIPVFKPLIEKEEIDAAVLSLEQGWLGMGASVGQFETALKEYLGCDDRHVVAVSTGHAALHLAMMLIVLKPGDEVITPSFNNIADFQAILAVGAEPVLCDIREDTLCIDVDKAESLIGPKTKAIIAMDYDCCLVDHDAIRELAERYNLRVIHDAAHSFGSYYKNQKIGTFSDICMFSFDPVKAITCIDGGALVVRTQEEVDMLHRMRLIGMGQPASVMYGNQRAWTYDVNCIGFRYHMPNLHAAIGLSQIKKMSDITKSRQKACRLYNELLSEVDELITPNTDFENVTPFLYYVRVPSESRQALRDWLKEKGIDTGIHWQPGHWFKLLSDSRMGDMSVTNRVGAEILSLPLHSRISVRDISDICSEVAAFFEV